MQIVIAHACRDKDVHIHEQYLQASYRNLASSTADLPAALVRCYQIFSSEDYAMPYRCAVIQRVMCTLLRSSKIEHATSFFAAQISDLVAKVSEKVRADSSPDLPSQLMMKSAVFTLLEVMYGLLPIQDVHAPGAKINIAFCGANPPSERGSDLTKFLCGSGGLFGALSETHLTHANTTLAELRRQYHCTAYNALAALISCTQTDPKFFNGFLFKETPSKAERLLDNLVDLTRFVFPNVLCVLKTQSIHFRRHV
jgi:hypothetical protein